MWDSLFSFLAEAIIRFSYEDAGKTLEKIDIPFNYRYLINKIANPHRGMAIHTHIIKWIA